MALLTQEPLVILLTVTAGQRSAPKIAIMTSGHPTTVLRIGKGAGGTTAAITQTSMVCTCRVRSVTKGCPGTIGKIPSTPLRGPR